MKIALIQIQSKAGAITENIAHHCRWIEKAVQHEVNFILFPELSITGYEPKLAKQLLSQLTQETLNYFQILSNTHNAHIGVGLPTESNNGMHISTQIFCPNKTSTCIEKHLLHEDELPYFQSGKKEANFMINTTNIGLGICYESLQPKHLTQVIDQGASLYMASVAKPQHGIVKAYEYFPNAAVKHNTPILMVNSLGSSDTFISAGQSAIWNHKGELLGALNATEEGFLIYDSNTQKTIINP